MSVPAPEIRFDRHGSIASVFIDGVEQSRVDLEHPDQLQFEYMEQMDVVLSLAHPAPTPIKAAHIGGCGCALAWAWQVQRPDSRQLAVEVDEYLATQARTWFPLPRKPLLRIRAGEGREVLSSSQAHFQVIVRDAFASRTVPAHLQTVEWDRVVSAHLAPTGLYLANAAHGGGSNARGDVAAARQEFGQVVLIGESKVLKGARWGNLVLAAWQESQLIDVAELDRRLRRLPLPVQVLSGAELDRWLGGHPPATD